MNVNDHIVFVLDVGDFLQILAMKLDETKPQESRNVEFNLFGRRVVL